MINRRYFLSVPAVLAGAGTGLANAQATPIKFVVPGSPGTGGDTVARFMARSLEKAWSRTILVENKTGAGGVIGTDFVAKSPPDGDTVLMTTANHYVLPWVYDPVPYNVTRDFAPVASFGSSALVLVVGAASPITNVRDLIARAKKEPDALSYSSAGTGTLSHMCGALMANTAGVKLKHVPYKAASQGLLDVSSGVVTMGFLGVAGALPLIKAGKLRNLAVTSAARSVHFPDVPSLAESGITGFDITSHFTAFVPAGTPDAAIQRLAQGFAQMSATAEFKEFCAAQGLEHESRTRQQFLAVMPKELDTWKKLVALTNPKGA